MQKAQLVAISIVHATTAPLCLHLSGSDLSQTVFIK